MSFRSFCVLLIFTLIIPACSIQQPNTVTRDISPGAEELSSLLSNINHSLNTVKGIGKAHMTREGRSFSARVAWAGSLPGKIRVEVVNTPGQSKTGFSSDGSWIYYFDPSDAKVPVKKISTEDATLKRFVSITIRPDEAVSLLSGRAPDFSYQSVRMNRSNNSDGYVLIREKKWWKGLQKIYIDHRQKEILKIESYAWNKLLFRAEFKKMMSVKGYRIPSRLVISNGEGDMFQLDVDRCWVNASIPPDMYVLRPPKQ